MRAYTLHSIEISNMDSIGHVPKQNTISTMQSGLNHFFIIVTRLLSSSTCHIITLTQSHKPNQTQIKNVFLQNLYLFFTANASYYGDVKCSNSCSNHSFDFFGARIPILHLPTKQDEMDTNINLNRTLNKTPFSIWSLLMLR